MSEVCAVGENIRDGNDLAPAPVFRILVSGSRKWADITRVRNDFTGWRTRAEDLGLDLVVRHGDATGLDRMVKGLVLQFRRDGYDWIHEESRPAQWKHPHCTHPRGFRGDGSWFCRAAGALRNQAMIDEGGIDEVFAYPLPGGTGTADCVRRAVDAKLVVTNRGFPHVTMADMLRIR